MYSSDAPNYSMDDWQGLDLSSGGGSPAVKAPDLAPPSLSPSDSPGTVPAIKPVNPSGPVDSSGNVTDAKTGLPLVVNGKFYNLKTGEVYASWTSDKFHVWIDDPFLNDPRTVALQLEAHGYQTIRIMASALQPSNDVAMGAAVPYALYLLAIAALIAFARKRHKQVGKVSTQDVLPFLVIGGGLLAFSVVKKILEFLGIWSNKDTKDLDAAAADASSFWNPNFWITAKPAGASWTYAIDEATAKSWCDEIDSSFGAFNDCEECVISVFKRCRTQANASFLCWVFQKYYGQDMLAYLRGGWWPQDRLSDADVNTINNFLKTLPAY